MYLSTLSTLLLGISTVNAGALRRDIAPFPSDTPTGTVSVDAAAQASAYNEGLGLSESPPDDGDVEADSIRLINFDGCSDMPGVTNAEAQIYSGWQQAQKIMAVQAIKDGAVDFNTAGALEYLGASGLNQPRQGDMNVIFKNFGTLTPAYWPFGWRIHVRCDDPSFRCTCGPSTEFAYTTNYDLESKLARINFCPRYFTTPTLNQVIADGKNLPAAQKYDMNRYWQTQGHMWAHELMHIDWVTGAYGPHGRYGTNEHVTDMIIQFTDSTGKVRKRKAYKPEQAKILARWPSNTGDYTIRNADNLALFMTSQYVQSQLDNAYPQYPIIDVSQPNVPPVGPSVYDTLFLFNSDGTVTLNETNPLAADFGDDGDMAACSTDEDESDPEPMVFSTFAPASAYPSDYIASLSALVASDTGTGSTAEPTETGSPYCIPFQDPDQGIDGYCQCNDGADFSFTSGDNPCPYTSPGPSELSLDPATITGTGGFANPPATTTAPPTDTSVGDPAFPYTWTDPFGDVVACETSQTSNAGSIPYTVCQGSSTTLTTGTPPESTPTPSISVQIWRWDHQLQGRTILTISSNMAIQAGAGETVDPCSGNTISSEGDGYLGSDIPGYHSDDISVNDKFDLKDGAKTGCTFTGKTADSGTLQCDDGFSVDCDVPDPGPANVCGAGFLNGCDLLTGACLPAYWLVATCTF